MSGSPPVTIEVSAVAARRFLIRAFALDKFQTLPSVPAALDRLEFVQEDSINICGRIHDLILRNRVADYTPAMLHQTLYNTPRQAFEFYFPNLCVLPMRDYPHFRRRMLSLRETPGRWGGLTAEEEIVAQTLFAQMDADGPLRSRLTGAEHGHAMSGWGMRTKVASLVLDKLWYQGHLLIERRENFERWFDRAARLHPEWESPTLPDPDEEARYKMRKRLRAKRLFRLPKDALATLGPAAFAPVRVEGDKRPWYILTEDKRDLGVEGAFHEPSALLLAPLDPLVYDRERNRLLWGFDYTWEVYTPAAKRRWGYYVLPVLFGDRLIGRVDPRIDRKTATLFLNAVTLEPDVDPDEVGPALALALHDFARFLGAAKIEIGTIEPKGLRKYINANASGVSVKL